MTLRPHMMGQLITDINDAGPRELQRLSADQDFALSHPYTYGFARDALVLSWVVLSMHAFFAGSAVIMLVAADHSLFVPIVVGALALGALSQVLYVITGALWSAWAGAYRARRRTTWQTGRLVEAVSLKRMIGPLSFLPKFRHTTFPLPFRVLVAYELDGRQVTAWSNVAPQQWTQLVVGTKVVIRVHPKHARRWVPDFNGDTPAARVVGPAKSEIS